VFHRLPMMRFARVSLRALVAGVVVAAGAVGASAKGGPCTYWNSDTMGSITLVQDGDCYYTDNYIVVDEMTGGKVTGGPGGSNGVNEMTGGTFNKGNGAGFVSGGIFNFDAAFGSVIEVSGTGTVNGGDGSQYVYHLLDGGVFNGGGGDDIVCSLDGGTFNGGGGNDTAGGQGSFDAPCYSSAPMASGTFNGGPGADTVNTMTGGTFSGGPGADTVTNYIDGTVWSADY
jgi:hypothetical protein